MLSEEALTIGAFAIGLAVTLVLAAYFTPRGWWKRPNARALAVLVAGTWGVGNLLLWPTQTPAMAATPVADAIVPAPASAGRTYHVSEDLNLRAGSGVSAKRVAVVPLGAAVTATGVRDGDWWEVRAKVGGKEVNGWVSSLWLRRADERRG